MARSYHSISRLFNHPLYTQPGTAGRPDQKSLKLPTYSHFETRAAAASSSRDEFPQVNSKKNSRKVSRAPRPLITVSTTSGSAGWHGKWNCDYVFTLAELQLADLTEDGQKDAEVFIGLSIQKHSGFGFSIEGRIVTAFNSKCSCCFSSYCREINTTFDVWVLPSSKSSEFQQPEIGGSDPSVIYVKPGSEANLDSLIQDTIRLTASAKDTCSESCERPAIIWRYPEGKRGYDQRWSRLLEIKNAI